MTKKIYEQFHQIMKLLKLDIALEYFLSKEINEHGLTLDEFSTHFVKALENELQFRNERKSIMRTRVASFPFAKDISLFDFDFNKQININEINKLLTLFFIEQNKNVIFLGPPGVGKTHLSISLGIAATRKKYGVYFVSAAKLINELHKAKLENRFETRLKKYASHKLLIIDELGYLPFSKEGGNYIFQLINARYQKKSTIITSNLPFSMWGDIFEDKIIASAILDRLLENCKVVEIIGRSYRTKKFAKINK